MGNSESSEEKEKKEFDGIKKYFNNSPPFQKNILQEKCIRYLVKKEKGKDYNLWVFNRGGFFDPDQGFIIGLYALYGLICSQRSEKELLLLHDCFLKRDKTFKNINGAEKLTEKEKETLTEAFKFLESALPENDIKNMFLSILNWVIGIGAVGAVVGACTGAITAEAMDVIAGVLIENAVGFGVAAIAVLAGIGIYYLCKKASSRSKEVERKINEDNTNKLFNILRDFFFFDGRVEMIDEKLKILEKNNLFIIKIDYGSVGNENTMPPKLEYKNIPGLSNCDYLPSSQIKDKLLIIEREYYRNIFKLYYNFFESFGKNCKKGDFSIDVCKVMKQFSESMKNLEKERAIITSNFSGPRLLI